MACALVALRTNAWCQASPRQVWFVLALAASSPALPAYAAARAPRYSPNLLFDIRVSLPVCDVWLGYRLFISMRHCGLFSVAKSNEGKFLVGKVCSWKSWWRSFGLCTIGYEFRVNEWLNNQIIGIGRKKTCNYKKEFMEARCIRWVSTV